MVPIRENLLSSAKYDLKVPVESCAKDMKYIVVHNTATVSYTHLTLPTIA